MRHAPWFLFAGVLACEPTPAPSAVTPAPVAAPVPSPPVTPTPPAADAPAADAPAADAPAAPAGDPAGPDTWTTGVVDAPRTGGAPALVTAVRVATHEGFERIVLEFQGNQVPGHHLEYVDRPARACASGDPLTIEGDGLLLLQVEPAVAHTDAGASTTPRESTPALANVREVERSCDFEGIVAYVVGVRSPKPFRVFELAAPPRLVVDIQR